MRDKVRNEVAKDRQRSQNAWAEVQQRVKQGKQRTLQARTQAGWNQRMPGLCQCELLLWSGSRHSSHCETLSDQHWQQPAEQSGMQIKSPA